MKLKPLTPESGCDGPRPLEALRQENTALKADAKAMRVLLTAERRRHAGIEALTLRLVSQLERQVDDLRSAYFQNLNMPTTRLEKR
jgi:hypothetical protein